MSSDIVNYGKYWISKTEIASMQKFYARREKKMHILMTNPTAAAISRQRFIQNYDSRKWARIKLTDKTERLVCVDNKTEKAYKVDYKTMSFTWMEIKKFTFIRWATTFDL